MGQDISIVLVAKKLPDKVLVDAAKTAFATEPPDNLVLLVAKKGPPSIAKAMPSFTAVSLWADSEADLKQFAVALSEAVDRCLVFTMADHACVGGWQAFEDGKPCDGEWVEGDGYTDAGIHGIEAAFQVNLDTEDDEATFFAESFLDEPSGLCVFGSAKGLRSGKPVSSRLVAAMLEFDLPDAELECVLLVGDE